MIVCGPQQVRGAENWEVGSEGVEEAICHGNQHLLLKCENHGSQVNGSESLYSPHGPGGYEERSGVKRSGLQSARRVQTVGAKAIALMADDYSVLDILGAVVVEAMLLVYRTFLWAVRPYALASLGEAIAVFYMVRDLSSALATSVAALEISSICEPWEAVTCL